MSFVLMLAFLLVVIPITSIKAARYNKDYYYRTRRRNTSPNNKESCPNVCGGLLEFLDTFSLWQDFAPQSAACQDGAICEIDVLSSDADDDIDPTTATFDCTHCQLEYKKEDVTECVEYACHNNHDCGNATSVNVCYQWTHAELLNVNSRSCCMLTTRMRSIGQWYTSGVSNIQSIQLVLKKQQTPQQAIDALTIESTCEEAPEDFKACTLLVDGSGCNSCRLCTINGEDEQAAGLFAADCTNHAANAVTTCAEEDSFAALGAVLLVLEEEGHQNQARNVSSDEFPVCGANNNESGGTNSANGLYISSQLVLALLVAMSFIMS